VDADVDVHCSCRHRMWLATHVQHAGSRARQPLALPMQLARQLHSCIHSLHMPPGARSCSHLCAPLCTQNNVSPQHSEQFEVLKDDPEFKHVFEEIQKEGPGAMQKYWEDTDMMSKISAKLRAANLQGGPQQPAQVRAAAAAGCCMLQCCSAGVGLAAGGRRAMLCMRCAAPAVHVEDGVLCMTHWSSGAAWLASCRCGTAGSMLHQATSCKLHA
jgi:hypothetical protein